MSDLQSYIFDHEESFRKARLPSLYSDLRVQKTTNPDGYAANVTAWQQALSHAARAGVIPASAAGANNLIIIRTSDDLVRALADSKYGRPMSLDAVFEESVQDGSMIPLQDFINTKDSIYSRPWLPSPWRILSWGLRQIGLASASYDAGNGNKLKAGSLVVLANLEDVGGMVLEKIAAAASSTVDRVTDVETFKSELSKLLRRDSGISDADTTVLLRYLERDKAALSCDGKTIKFKPPSSPLPSPITPQDTTIASLKTLISNLTTQCATLSTRISTLHTTVTSSLKSHNRPSALSALRSKKLAENTLTQRSSTLHQLEDVLAQIAQAADQVEIVRVMEASAGVLKGLNREVGGVEKVEDVIEGLREEMEKTEEVGQVIGEGVGGVGGQTVVDEEEVDAEMERMEREERREVEEREAREVARRLEEVEGEVGAPKKEEEEEEEVGSESLQTPSDRQKEISISNRAEEGAEKSGAGERVPEHAS